MEIPFNPKRIVFKVRHQQVGDQNARVIEKLYYRFAGIECICGHTTFKGLWQGTFIDNKDYRWFSYFCARCGEKPMMITPKLREELFDAREMLEWLGRRRNYERTNR